MNILTFDIEEWYIEKVFHGGRSSSYKQFDKYLNSILDLLDECHLSATFFCVGQLAAYFPEVIKQIADRGHEIGCHSNTHTWLYNMSRNDLFEDTRISVDILQQCSGSKVQSYRAPAFSIRRENAWAFEVLGECGIEYDSSIFPAKRDFGGFSDYDYQAPTLIKINNHIIKEFPIGVTRIFGRETAYSGGGYFRLYPLWFVKNRMESNDYNMCYFHIGDLLTEQRVMTREEYENYFKEPGTFRHRYLRYLKSSIGINRAFAKVASLLRSVDFVSIDQTKQMINWDFVPVVTF